MTGGAGFIGSWVVRVLLKKGYKVTVFDNLSTGHKELVPHGAKLVRGDIRRKDQLVKALRGHDAVIHLAAKTLVSESVKKPDQYFRTNLVGGLNVLEAMRELGIKKIVHSSTAAVYGTPKRVPIKEDDPKFPINPYGATKLALEAMMHTYHANYGFDVTMFRYFNPFGPGEKHDPETHAVPNFIKATLTGKEIPLYWKGSQRRDFFYVEDIAIAHVMGLKQSGFHYYNLGSGQATRVIDLVKMIFDISGKRADISDLGERPGDPPSLMAEIAKVKKELGWAPKTDLRIGLKKTINSFKGIAG